jgi:hypothetical protein
MLIWLMAPILFAMTVASILERGRTNQSFEATGLTRGRLVIQCVGIALPWFPVAVFAIAVLRR